ncbi:hypothetical protein LCGC14_0920200 [marine sediment metagenome]|uniref:DUF1508 domain-containing protein n=1 Tax=marine sediment metagenome TaxID=412755 RepID=A0A0F9NR53_9ZZZZ
MTTSALTFEVYRDKAREFRWRLRSTNGQTIATSGEGYKDKRDCEAGIFSIQSASQASKVIYLESEPKEDPK